MQKVCRDVTPDDAFFTAIPNGEYDLLKARQVYV